MKTRILRMFLTVMMVVGMMTGFAINVKAQEYAGYIANIGIVAEDSAEEAKRKLTETGHTVIDHDLNEGAGGKRIYMGYKTTRDRTKAIYSLEIFWNRAADWNSYQGYQVIGTDGEPNTAGGGRVNLNEGTGGASLYLAVKRWDGATNSIPIGDIQITYSAIPQQGSYRVSARGAYGDEEYTDVHLNLDAEGGKRIYMHFKNMPGVIARPDVYHLSEDGTISNPYIKGKTLSLLDDTYIWDEQPKKVTYKGQAYTFLGWRETLEPSLTTVPKAVATYENQSPTYYAVYSNDWTLTYHANGGINPPKGQTQMQYLYTKQVAVQSERETLTIPEEVPTHNDGAKFFAWSDTADGSGAVYFPGDTLILKKDTTLYALWAVSSDDCTLTLAEGVYSYLETNAPLTPEVIVKKGEQVLVEGKDYNVLYTNNLQPGVATVTVTLKGQYTGSLKTWFHIQDIDFHTDPETIAPPAAGESRTVRLFTTVDGKEVSGASYILNEANQDYPEGITVTDDYLKISTEFTGFIDLKGNYNGYRQDFSIWVQPQMLPEAVLSERWMTFNNMEQKPVIIGFNGGQDLREGQDYTVTYLRGDTVTEDFTSVGEITILVTGINDYTGEKTYDYSIEQEWVYNAKADYVTLVSYNGQPQKPELTLRLEETGYVLQEGIDYTVSYERDDEVTDDLTSPGYVRMVITGQGNFQGKEYCLYFISEMNITDSIQITTEDVTYDGEEHKPTVSVNYDNNTLVENTDYTVTCQRNGTDTDDFTSAGTVTVTVTGMGIYTGSKTVSYTISPRELTESHVTVSETNVWNGSPQKPEVEVHGVLESDYTVIYTRNGEVTDDFTTCGTITVTVVAEGNYTGTVSKEYVITHAADWGCGHASLMYQAPGSEEVEFTNDTRYLEREGTITLLQDITVDYYVEAGNATIVMNGHSITMESGAQLFSRTGPLTIDASRGGSFSLAEPKTWFVDLIWVEYELRVIGNPVFGHMTGIRLGLDDTSHIDLSLYTGDGLVIYNYSTTRTQTPTLPKEYGIVSWTSEKGPGDEAYEGNTIPFYKYGMVKDFHVHNRIYTSSGNTIIGTCIAENCRETEGKTIIISAADKIYDGEEAMAAVANYVDSTDYRESIVYKAKTGSLTGGRAVNVGTYTAELTVSGANASVEFDIRRRPITITAEPQTITSGQSISNTAFLVENMVSGNSAEVTLTPDIGEAVTKGSIIPSEAVIKDVSGNDVTANYEITYRNGLLTINKAVNPAVNTPEATQVEYGQTLLDSLLSDNSWKWGDPTAVPAGSGTYEAYLEVDDKSYDYDGVTGYDPITHRIIRQIPVEVRPATPVITVQPTPAFANVGETVTVSATVRNPHNESLSDLPAPTYTYKMGDSGEEKEFTDSFMIPDNTKPGTVITIVATTPADDRYTTGTGRATVTVLAPGEPNPEEPTPGAPGFVVPDGIWIQGIREDLTYNGRKQTQDIRLYDGETLLREKKDYTISFKNNTNAFLFEDYRTDGKHITQNIGYELKNVTTGVSLNETDTFDVATSGLTKKDKKKIPQMTIRLKGNYKGTITVYFEIAPVSLSDNSIVADNPGVMYNKKKQTPLPTVTWNGKKLTARDFEVKEYVAAKQDKTAFKGKETENTEYPLTLAGKGNFRGERNITLTIAGKTGQVSGNTITNVSAGKITVKGVKTLAWDPAKAETGMVQDGSTMTFKYKDAVFEDFDSLKDVKIRYAANKRAGTAALIIEGTGIDSNGDGYAFVGTKRVNFKINGMPLNRAKVAMEAGGYVYTGKPIEPLAEDFLPKVTVTDNTGRELTAGVHFAVTYSNNVNRGTATMILTAMEESGYTGTLKQTFKIVADTIDNKTAHIRERFMVSINDPYARAEGAMATPYHSESGIPARYNDHSYYEGEAFIVKMPYAKGGVTPQVTVTDPYGRVLTEKIDYTVKYDNNRNVTASGNMASVTVKGKGNYTGEATVEFVIEANDTALYPQAVRAEAKDKFVKPGATLKKNSWKSKVKLLDYAGKALSGKEADTKHAIYTIASLPQGHTLTPDQVQKLESYRTAGLPDKLEFELPVGTTIQVTVSLLGDNYKGSVTGTYRILEAGRDIAKARIKIADKYYTGQEITLDQEDITQAVMKGEGQPRQLVLEAEGTNAADFQIVPGSYVKNVNKGTARVTFRGVGEYGGTKTVTFKIRPREAKTNYKSIYGSIFDLF